MGHVGPGRQGHGVVWIERGSASHPPASGDDCDEAIVGMEVRPAEMIALEPLVADDVKPRFRWIAYHYRVLRACRGRRAPLDLIGQSVDEHRRIEFDGSARRRRAEREQR